MKKRNGVDPLLLTAIPEVALSDLFSAEGVNGLDAIFSKKCMHAAADTMNFAFSSNANAFCASVFTEVNFAVFIGVRS